MLFRVLSAWSVVVVLLISIHRVSLLPLDVPSQNATHETPLDAAPSTTDPPMTSLGPPSSSEASSSSRRRGRILNLDSNVPSLDGHASSSSSSTTPPLGSSTAAPPAIQGRILNGHFPSLDDLSANAFPTDPLPSVSATNQHLGLQQDTQTVGGQQANPQGVRLSYPPPTQHFSSLSYASPTKEMTSTSGATVPHHAYRLEAGDVQPGALYQLVPVHLDPSQSTATKAPPTSSMPSFFELALEKMKEGVTGGMQKMKHALGLAGNGGFSEKVSSPVSPDALFAVAPVAAGLLAGSLAVAYFAARQSAGNASSSGSFGSTGKRTIRDVTSEEQLNQVVATLDPVQREYLQKLQLYGPQRWKDVTCAKFIFCDVMSKATPLHVLDMQRKVGLFLSRMDEATARYVEVILKDVMLAIQARDCSRFSCGPSPWGLPPLPPPPPPPPIMGHPLLHPQHLPPHNFIRRQ